MKKISYYLIILAVLGVGAVISRKAYREYKRNQLIQKEIDTVKEQAEKLKKNNDDIREKISYLETEDFKEWEAKKKLNFQRPEENVAIVRPSPSREAIGEIKKNEERTAPEPSIPNWKKWWNYFFGQ